LCNVQEINDGFLVYTNLERECQEAAENERKAAEEKFSRERFALVVANVCGAADGGVAKIDR
jgi:hypothetical protein